MNKQLIIITASLFLTVACRKPVENAEDILPKVETVEAFVDSNGLFTMVGRVISEGTSQIYHLGGCYSLEPNPAMLDNQKKYAEYDGEYFIVKYSEYEKNSPIYFRVWATNSSTFSYGEIIKLDSLIFPEVNAPCTPVANKVNFGDGWGDIAISSVSSPSNGTCLVMAPGSRSLTFSFGSNPWTHIFTTTKFTPEGSQVRLRIKLGTSVDEYADAGASIYVNQLGPNSWNIKLCDVPWMVFGSPTTVSADINYPL